MLNFLKSLVPNLIIGLGWCIEFLGKGLVYLGTMITHAGIQGHVLLRTKLGIKFKALEEAMRQAVETIMAASQNLQSQQQGGDSRLVNMAKDKPQASVQVVSLGKKDDESES
jgi:hypothetical protein